MTDPPGSEVKKSEVKEPEVKEVIVKEPYKYKGQYEVQSAEADNLIERGMAAIQAEEDAKTKEVEDKKIEEETKDKGKSADLIRAEKRIENMEKKIEDAEKRAVASQQHQLLATNITVLSANDKFMKEHPGYTNEIQVGAMEAVVVNPKLSPQQALDQSRERVKKIHDAARSTYIKGKVEDKATTQGERGSGEGGVLETNDPTTLKDLQKGKGRKALLDLVKSGKAWR